MNPHSPRSSSLYMLICSLWKHRRIMWQMTQREVIGRYKGSILGVGWSFFNPLMMLAVYTFVFSVVFKARWGVGPAHSKTDFALILFVGLIIHALFAEVVNRSPVLILSNVNFVKKVVFPLEILTVVSLGAALFHAFVSVCVLLIAFVMLNGFMNWSVLYIPLTILPLLPLTIGVGWFLSSLGVYLRDISQIIGVVTTILLFLAPVFYPLSAIPEGYQTVLLANPLTFIIEQTRGVIIFGRMPDWIGLAIYSIISVVVCWVGYWWFQKTRKGFADVL